MADMVSTDLVMELSKNTGIKKHANLCPKPKKVRDFEDLY